MSKAIAAALAFLPLAAVLIWQRQSQAAVMEEAPPAELTFEPAPAQLPELSFLEGIGIMTPDNTRGERNNNPGNIRKSGSNWQGKVDGVDPSFETFADPESGLRALAKLLKNYQVNYGLRTVRAIVSRWAPNTENNTAAYVKSVAERLGVGPDDAINLNDQATLAALVEAIVIHENGRNIYADAQIDGAARAV